MHYLRFFFIFIATALILLSLKGRDRFIINSPMDLNGDTIVFPHSSILVFRKSGSISNGYIVGNDITVKASKRLIFKNVVLRGMYHAESAFSDWFGASPDCVLDQDNTFVSGTDNHSSFQNLLLFDNVFISPGTYMVSKSLFCRDNQTIEGNGATIKSCAKSSLLCLGKDGDIPQRNVMIKDLNLIGAKNDYSDKIEWWHGVQVGYATDVVIDNVRADFFRGDGFYVGTGINKNEDSRIPSNIVLRNIEAHHNHRQGLSITRVKGILVENSVFCDTQGTAPMAGIDIEPNTIKKDNGEYYVGECEDITIDHCLISGNGNYGILILSTACFKPSVNIISNVVISNCRIEGDISISGCSGCRLFSNSLSNSSIIVKFSGRIEDLEMVDMTMTLFDNNNKKNAIDFFYNSGWAKRRNIVIRNIEFQRYGGTAINFGHRGVLDNTLFEDVTIEGCRFIECGNEINAGRSVSNLRIIND